MKLLYLFLSLFLQTVLAAPHLSTRNIPVPPSQDPFYQPPAGFESQPVGSILRHRIRENLFGIVVLPEKVKQVHQFLVRSENSFGVPNAILTTLFIPYNADPSKLLSYQAAEDAAFIDCLPLYAMQLLLNPATILTPQVEQLLAQTGLNAGWYVVIPDFEGPNSTYTVGKQAGYATLNSIRAVLSSSNVTGINNDANVVLWGYSGGSQPASWGAFLHPEYAPEINLVGSAFGGIIADIDSIARYNLGKLTAGFVFAAINGLAQEYSQLAEFLKEKVYSSQYAKFTLPKSTCLIEYVPAFIFLTLEDFSSGGIGLLDDPIVKNITDLNNSINKNFKPTAPLFMYNSIADEIVPAGDADKLYDNLCSNGATIQYRQDILGEHGIQAVTGAPMAFEFLKDRLDGVPIARGCSKQLNLSNALTPQGLKGLPVIIVTALLTLIGVPVGVYSWLI